MNLVHFIALNVGIHIDIQTQDRLVSQLAAHVCALSNDVLSELHLKILFCSTKVTTTGIESIGMWCRRRHCVCHFNVSIDLCVLQTQSFCFLFSFQFKYVCTYILLAITNKVTKACCLLFSTMFNRNVVEQKYCNNNNNGNNIDIDCRLSNRGILFIIFFVNISLRW